MNQAAKLNNLISELLDVSKIEAGKLPINREEFDIRQLVEQTIDIISLSNTNFTITLSSSVDTQLIIGDANRIEQVLINLLNNAIRYSANSRIIEVYLDKNDNFIIIGVKDYGLEIESKNFERIFSRFYRADNTGTTSGLGLGLYLCHQIVQQHQGKIWVESEVSKGSIFWVQLPLN